MSRVVIQTNAEFGNKTQHQLTKYIQELVVEQPDRSLGKFESLEQNLEYAAGILGRLIERAVLADLGGIKNPKVLDYVLFGSNTNHVKEVNILKDDSDDDIPF